MEQQRTLLLLEGEAMGVNILPALPMMLCLLPSPGNHYMIIGAGSVLDLSPDGKEKVKTPAHASLPLSGLGH